MISRWKFSLRRAMELLTGWEDYDRINQKEAGAHARGEGNDSTAPTTSAPTLTRRGRGGAPASISSVSQPRTNVNEKEQAAIQKGDRDAVDKINKQQIKVARDALKMYKE